MTRIHPRTLSVWQHFLGKLYNSILLLLSTQMMIPICKWLPTQNHKLAFFVNC